MSPKEYLINVVRSGCVVLTLGYAQPNGEAKAEEVDVQVRVDRGRDRDYRLEIAIINLSSRSIAMYESQLPWASRNSLSTIAFVPGFVPQILKQQFAVDDPDPKQVELKAQTRKVGSISLNERFPSLAGDTSKFDVALCWYYRYQPLLTGPVKIIGGLLVIPRRE